MYAYQAKWHIKEGRIQEAVELLQGVVNSYKARGMIGRLYYSPQVSQKNILVWEENWETPEAHDKWWADESEARSSERAKIFWAKWAEVTEGEAKNEIWSLTN